MRADWARAHVQVFDYITEAQRRNDPLALERGLKWYLVLHDVLLRGARRTSRGGGRGTTYLAQRFDAWRRGDRLTLASAGSRRTARGAGRRRGSALVSHATWRPTRSGPTGRRGCLS